MQIERAKNIALSVQNPGTFAHFDDLMITGTERSECVEFSCNTGVADGANVLLQAVLEMERFHIDANGQYGVRVVNESVLSMVDGTVSNHPVGAQIIVEDYDARQLMRGVRYVDNDENFSVLAQ